MRRVAVLLAVLLLVCVGGVSAKDFVKVISSKNITQEEIQIAEADFDAREHGIETVKIPKGIVKQNHLKKLSITVETNPRSSGGITVELFCKDNTGRFMPVWGGSITQAVSDWAFTEQDIKRQNIDGCYFAVIDSTAEMEGMA